MKQIKNSLKIDEGIFSAFNCPIWQYAFPDAVELDTYFFLRYGDRISNKLIAHYEGEDGLVTGDNLTALAAMIYNINAKRWEHLFGIYNAEYNPIENTDFIETIKEHTDSEGNVDTSSSASAQASNSTSNNRYGFNSSTAVGDTATSSSGSNSSSGSSSTDTDNTVDHTSEHRKHGNIGVTEATVMLQHEADFWGKWSFIDQVCKDICDMIALSIYQ